MSDTARRVLSEPVALLPVDMKWDWRRKCVHLPSLERNTWVILVYCLHPETSLRGAVSGVVSVLIQLNQSRMFRRSTAMVSEIHPPRHLEASSRKEDWLRRVNSNDVANHDHYHKRPFSSTRLRNVPGKEIKAVASETRLYNHTAYQVKWDIVDCDSSRPFLVFIFKVVS